jgi:hypothetical protein
VIRHHINIGDEIMTRDPQGDMLTAMENYRLAVENGTLTREIIRAVVETINAAR